MMRTWSCALLGVALLLACAPGQERGTSHRGHASAGEAEGCARCHGELTREWEGSAHARAWTDPLVQREYSEDPDPSCVGCHAPGISDPTEPAIGAGVGCRSCHDTPLGVSSAGRANAAAETSAAGACAACHQFGFLPVSPVEGVGPRPLSHAREGWLQDTVGEWSRSRAAAEGITCNDCHMPWIGEGSGRHRSHAFPGMSAPALLAEAVEVELHARREGGRVKVAVWLEGAKIGHAFPTGDLFRVALLRVWTEEREPDEERYLLKRWFAAMPRAADGSGGELVEVEDTRLAPPGSAPARHLEFRLRSPAARHVRWSLDLYAATHDPPLPSDPRTRVGEGRVKIESRAEESRAD